MNDIEKIHWIADRLMDGYGTPEIQILDPVENLVLTILSQNTNDNNRDRAYSSLLKAFGTLDDVRRAPVTKIAQAIQVGGLHRQKSQSIQNALEQIVVECGSLDLSFLTALPLHQAMTWLTSLPGVGPKTAGIVLLFSFNRPYFPADTHIRRVMSRMGLVSPHSDPHTRLNEILPSDPLLMQRLHLLTIQLGRQRCHPKNPECLNCPLKAKCSWEKAHGSTREDGVTSPNGKGGRSP